ncbi:MAG: NapH/MauN family ferredoxin-type protein [Burkholderiales bacterium]|jgi:ferredoxin-type protein NapH|nr:NapH/MauN family ferredoxin-type protein [Burkholderiales bacterium]
MPVTLPDNAARKEKSFLQTFVAVKGNHSCLSIRFYRFVAVILCALLFVFSYRADIQILEGSLVGSRFVGFHLIDPFVCLEVWVSAQTLPVNLAIGAASIVLIYLFLGGRMFCSWVCPYGLLSEIGEWIHLRLIERKIIQKHPRLPLDTKYYLLALFLILNMVTGVLVFEFFNAVGIISRCLIYGFSFSILWVVFVFLVEVFYSRRLWCRSFCPVGATYGLLNKLSMIKIKAKPSKCTRCGDCLSACHVPEALAPVFHANDQKSRYITLTDCTLCGRCVDRCRTQALSFGNKLKDW